MKQYYIIRWDEDSHNHRHYQFTKNPQEQSHKKRFGIKLNCKTCGLKISVGGVYTEKNLIEQFLFYEKNHWDNCRGNFIINRSYHATEINHTFIEDTTNRTTTLTDAQITNMSVASSFFTTSKQYLITSTAAFSHSDVAENGWIWMKHGTTNFTGSIMKREPMTASSRYSYAYFTVWTAVVSEGIDMRFGRPTAGTVGSDQSTIFIMNLSDDLTENTDWVYASDSSSLTHTTTFATEAAATINPPVESQDWLNMVHAHQLYNNVTVNCDLRINDFASATSPLYTEEGEDSVFNDELCRVIAKVNTGVSTGNKTVSVEVRDDGTSAGTQNVTDYSQAFALNLHKFAARASVYTAASTGNLGADYATNCQTVNITPTITGDIFIWAQLNNDPMSLGEAMEMRLQVSNADQPPSQTTDNYEFNDNSDTTNAMPWIMQTVENLTTGAKTLDIDGSVAAADTVTVDQRVLFAFSMELATTPPVTLTHTTNSLLKKLDNLKTHTTDSLLKKPDNTLIHTTNSLLKKPDNTLTHTTDSLLKKFDLIRTHTTDSLLKKLDNILTHNIDSLLKKLDNLLIHTTDSFLQGQKPTVTHTTNSLLKKFDLTLIHTTDSLKALQITITHTTNSLLKRIDNVLIHSTDSLLKKLDKLLSHTTNSLLLLESSKNHTTNSLLKKLDNIKIHTTDSLLKKLDNLLIHQTDSLKKRVDNIITHTTDSLLKKLDNLKTHTTDSLRKKLDVVKTHTTSSFITAFGLFHTTNSYIAERIRGAFAILPFKREERQTEAFQRVQ